MEHCNWLIKKRDTEEPIRCRNLYWPLKVGRDWFSVVSNCTVGLFGGKFSFSKFSFMDII